MQIIVNDKQIVEYLNNKFEEEEPLVKTRLESQKSRQLLEKRIDLVEITDTEIDNSSQQFIDQLVATRYEFDSYTLNYFNKYSDIVRNKAKKILYIIESIADRNYSNIFDLIEELDIQLDENGNISKEDIIRLIPPFICNYNSLFDKVNTANNLETYLTFKLSENSVYRNGCSEDELYPTRSIQSKNLYYDYLPDNISLSNNQKRILRNERSKKLKKFAKTLLDW